jgi:SAM-dependent methyltransferase
MQDTSDQNSHGQTRGQVVVAEPAPLFGDWHRLDRDREAWAGHYSSIMAGDDRFRGRVLDIGCGDGALMPIFRAILNGARQVDGVEPTDAIAHNPFIIERWHSTLDDAPVPEDAYDAALAFFVFEHVASPIAFMRRLHCTLRAGGVCYAITPHVRHPFAWIVRTLNATGLKSRLAKAEAGENPYPTYYRMNSRSAIRRATRGLDFARIEVHYAPSVHWDRYFPRSLRAFPHLYDRMIAIHRPAWAQLVMFKIEK